MPSYPIPFNEEARVAATRGVPGLGPGNEALFESICELTRQLFDCPIAHISVVEADHQWYKCVVGMELGPMPKEQSFCTHAIISDDLMVVPDLSQDPKFARHPMVAEGGPGARFYAGVPLVLSSGYRFGSLCALDLKPHERPGPEKLAMLEELGRMAVAALEGTAPPPPAPPEETGPSAFVTLIGHELRTPLSVMLGGLGLLEARCEAPAHRRLAGSARRSARHLAELVETIIRYSNAETGELHLKDEATDLGALLAELTEAYLPLAHESGKAARLGVQGIDLPVLVDREQIKIAVTALAFNALYHGGQALEISTGFDAQGNIEIRLSDDGTLDDRVELARLYEPFVVGGDLETRGSHGGLGLGLPLTRKLIELHGGDFEVHAAPGSTTAVIRLPRWRAEVLTPDVAAAG